MLRVLLVLEDYGEMLFLQTLLKKMGFDVDGMQNPRGLNDHIISMNPDILVMTAFGKRVNGFELAGGLKRSRGIPKVLLMHSMGMRTPPSPHVEGWIVSPTTAMDFLRMISSIGGVDLKQVEEKYHKLTFNAPVEGIERELIDHRETEPSFTGADTVEQKLTRDDRSAAFLAQNPAPKELTFNRKQIEENVKDLRRTENPEKMATVEAERRAFVNELFKK